MQFCFALHDGGGLAGASSPAASIPLKSFRSDHELRLWISEGLTQSDSLVLRGGIPGSRGNFPEIWTQRSSACGLLVT